MKTLTVIPLATPQTVPQNSLEAVKSVDRLYLQTTEHICANAALRIRPEAVSMDDLYSECFDFDELNERIAERLAAAFESENAENLNVGYAVLGRGVEGELAALLCSRANENRIYRPVSCPRRALRNPRFVPPKRGQSCAVVGL